MGTSLDILAITGPIYLTIALGFLATRNGLFAKADMQVFGKFTINLALPALLFNALSQRSVAEILNTSYLLAQTLRNLLKNPMIIGMVAGFAFSFSGLSMPAPLGRTIHLFAQSSAVLSLFVIGGSLVGLKSQGLQGTVMPIALGKLVPHPLAMWALKLQSF